MTQNVRVLLGLGVGLAGGWIVGDRAGWLSTTAEIVGTLWVNAIRMTALPLVVALLVAGVGSVGEPRTIGRLGGRALALFVLMLACAGTFAGIVSPLALRWLSVDGATAAVWSSGAPPKAAALSLTQFLMQVIPVNPFQAAAEGTGDFSPATIVFDEPTTWSFDNQEWSPRNYDGEYDGAITLRRALAMSRNVAAVKVAEQTGYERVV